MRTARTHAWAGTAVSATNACRLRLNSRGRLIGSPSQAKSQPSGTQQMISLGLQFSLSGHWEYSQPRVLLVPGGASVHPCAPPFACPRGRRKLSPICWQTLPPFRGTFAGANKKGWETQICQARPVISRKAYFTESQNSHQLEFC